MKAKRSLEDFFASGEESSLVSLVEIVKMANGPLRTIFRHHGLEHCDLSGRLMNRVNDFSYQDEDDVLETVRSRARFCDAVFSDGRKHICLLGAILSTQEAVACRVLESISVDCEKLFGHIAKEFDFEIEIFNYKLKGGNKMTKVAPKKRGSVVASDYGVDLTERYKNERPEPFIGRDKQLLRLVRMLGKMKKNSVLLLGGTGVGKTSLIDDLAHRIASKSISGPLAGMTIFRLELESLEDLPKRFCDMGDYILKVTALFNDLDRVVFVMDWQEIILPGADGDIFTPLDAIGFLSRKLRESKVRFVFIGHPDSYENILVDNPETPSLVGIMRLEEATDKETYEMMMARKASYEKHHGVSFSEAAIKKVLNRSANVYDGTYLPGRALELLDDLGSDFSVAGTKEVGEKEVEEFFNKEKSEPVVVVGKESYEKRLLGLPDKLKGMVIGQDAACDLVSDAVMAVSDPNRPIASMFFAGPSGVGKTLLAQSLAKALFDEDDCFLRLDMSEFQEKHEVSRLTGAPPSYIGYDDENKLGVHVKKHQRSVILLDEIEKAHPSIYDILLQVLDYGCLTNGKGERMCFRNRILIMTSNIDLKKGGGMGFGAAKTDDERRMDFGKALQDHSFRKEFVGRLDQSIEFAPLSHVDFLKIIDLEIAKIAEAAKKRGLAALEFEPEAKDFVVGHSETREYGARNLNGALRRLVRVPLGKMLVYGGAKDKVTVKVGGDGLVFV